jgi:hypothetical protein
MPWAVYFWPGLAQLAHRGSWAGLGLAIVAAVLLNITLLGTFVWSELIGSDLRIICWVAVGLVWTISGCVSAWSLGGRSNRRHPAAGDPFSAVIDSYLKGNWIEAERLLDGLLRRNSRDLEARLMLVTLLRHTKRIEEATRQLNVLVRLDGAQRWNLEMHREGELLAEARRNTITTRSLAQAENGEN